MAEEPTAEQAGQARRSQRIAYGVGAVKVVFVLALFRLFAAPMSKDLLGKELLPMPTWEWSLCSVTPVVLIYLLRRPSDWMYLRGERTILRIALCFYLVYGAVFALAQGEKVLWVSVFAGIGGLWGLRELARRGLANAG
ncbi:hypothetical protein ABZ397_01610 [Streptomyces sp. NPDC005876]|jgi:hypothetical protein|uniref:hypothetical protein n=1 Tax=Streptomyces sp. NPDC005876 TaxID=3157076 RepID=UPI0033DE54BD